MIIYDCNAKVDLDCKCNLPNYQHLFVRQTAARSIKEVWYSQDQRLANENICFTHSMGAVQGLLAYGDRELAR